MRTARTRPSATLLRNGLVLITGGISTTIVANAEIYNPEFGVWRSIDSLTIPRLQIQSQAQNSLFVFGR
jgi:hypothetical protein